MPRRRPGARAPRREPSPRAATAAGFAAGRRTRPLRLAAGDRRPRGGDPLAAPRHRDGRAQRCRVRRRDRHLARAAARHDEASYQQLIVQRGRRRRRLARAQPRPALALPFVPAEVARERERAGAYAERTAGSGLLSDVLVEEVRRGERLVAIDEEAALICPWASRSPFELRVVPRRESASFGRTTRSAPRCSAPRCGCSPSASAGRRS